MSSDHATAVDPSSPLAALGNFRVLVAKGKEKGASAIVEAEAPIRMLVGSSSACTLCLTDRRVSRRHLALSVTERGLHVTDLGSTNGTFINGLRVESAFAFVGSEIQLGDTVLAVELAAPPRDTAFSSKTSFGRTIGASPAMRRLYPLCERAAAS